VCTARARTSRVRWDRLVSRQVEQCGIDIGKLPLVARRRILGEAHLELLARRERDSFAIILLGEGWQTSLPVAEQNVCVILSSELASVAKDLTCCPARL
jgi:hypothetical protein